jgi:type I restriction enzyme S subunit
LTSKDYVDLPGVPVSRGNNLTMAEERYIDRDFVFVSDRKAATLIQNTAFPGDLVFTQRGTIGQIGLIPQVARFSAYILSQNQMKLRSDGDKADSVFLYYYFISPVAQNLIQQNCIGSTIPGFNLGQLREFPLLLPPLAEQKAIAAVLGALDDKIELNRRMNATLEAMARALFQSWFADFDPVRAKLDGRPPAHLDAATAALFPASFQDSALGEIPHSWRLGTLGELVQLRTDRVDATPAKDSTRYIALEDMPSKSIDLSNFQLGSAVNSSITAFRKGDVLFGSMRPYFHKVGLAFFDGITRTTTFVLRPRKDCFPHFALLHFFSDDVVAHSTTASVGTTIPYVRWDSMESYRIPIPPDSLLEAFEKTVRPLVQRIAAQGEESRTLATLRDTLLPKLLSGEIRLANAEIKQTPF